ncbi:hypothetical protein CBM2633_B90086 [Cupriavidus taiwanensis]|uniref:Uncharacterized protein n=1 Tax=Cupriavidus taiwanensis TaxID=164546 RepID=A0A375J770_9BURK|nr:hypothetical protein CBM2610_B50341 [Cupriavidus taiwanensis]SPA01356.1 hypothetical protein CBM2626_B110298 [Cupriavidus taiwanensis]SPA22795.1 hypothetical protein CBM2633_B90086 [Cupriavidus taiwanensis]SPR99803.1 hypothetical protein CBM2634_B120013 [Cupriavidus taiwanensis]
MQIIGLVSCDRCSFPAGDVCPNDPGIWFAVAIQKIFARLKVNTWL